jgi:hypothetical protein
MQAKFQGTESIKNPEESWQDVGVGRREDTDFGSSQMWLWSCTFQFEHLPTIILITTPFT